MKSTDKDARGFVEGVVDYLKNDEKGARMAPKTQTLLYKLTAAARHEREAKVQSAVELTTEEKSELASFLLKLTGHEIRIQCVVNKELIAGISIQMADWVLDTSLRGSLEQMSRLLRY